MNKVVKLGNKWTFKNVREAGKFLVNNCDIDAYNAVDCVYKALRSEGKKTHGYHVERLPDHQIMMAEIVGM